MNNLPFHNSNAKPLPDANDIEREINGPSQDPNQQYEYPMSDASKQHLAADKRKLRNFIVGLLVAGLVVGGALSVGLVWVMNQLDLTNPPTIEDYRRGS